MSDERKLATIRRVSDIKEIVDADNIELAIVDGWQVVVKKSDFQIDDLAVYFEIDSFLPTWPEFKFLEKSCLRTMGKEPGLRLRTIKLRGEVSQGLLHPLDRVNGEYYLNFESQSIYDKVVEGDDVTELLSIKKWGPPLPANLSGKMKGYFPSFIPKTDQERVQNFYKYFTRHYSDHSWEASIKLDGSSFTAYIKDGNFGVCSRRMNLEETEDNAFWKVARKYNLPELMTTYGKEGGNFAIQGELVGPGIQGNHENLSELDLYVFNVYDIDNSQYLNPDECRMFASLLGLNHVPTVDIDMDLSGKTINEILEMADGPSLNNKIREGIVFKSNDDPNVSFKAISNKFLLKCEE